MAELCPACGLRDQDTPSGLCSPCVVDRAASNYSEADRQRAQGRTLRWGQLATATRTDAQLATLRQQRHRQIEALRPRQASASTDPWELAIEALGRLKRLIQSCARHRGEIDNVAEAIRRLAWGPDDGEVWIPKARPRTRRQIPGQLMLFDEAFEVAA